MVKFNISTVANHFAILLNGFLIWLIWKKSGKPLENYRKILYLGAIFDFIFSIIIVLTEPTVIFTNDWYFMVLDGWAAYLGHPLDWLLVCLNVYLSYSTIPIAGIQFVYRYLLICWNIKVTKICFCILLVLAFSVSSYYLYIWLFNFYPKTNEWEIYGPVLFATGKVKKEDVISFLVSSRLATRPTIVFSAIISIGSFSVIIFCSVSIIYKLWKHQKNFAAADRKIQNQISIVLFCEAIVPLLTMVIPLQFLALFNSIFPWFPSVFSYITAFSPLFNPIVKMIVISPFRKTIFGFIIQKKQISSMTSLVSITTSVATHR